MNFTHAYINNILKNVSILRFLHASIINESIAIVEYKPEAVVYISAFPISATILDI